MEATGGAWTIAVIVVAIIGFAAGLFALFRFVRARNERFLTSRAIVAQELPPAVLVSARFQTHSARPHAVWLDLDLGGGDHMGFELWLAIKVGGLALVEGSFAVGVDHDDDLRGLPDTGTGIVTLNTVSSSTLSTRRLRSVVRIFRFDVREVPSFGELHVRVIPSAGCAFTRSRVLLTVGESPF